MQNIWRKKDFDDIPWSAELQGLCFHISFHHALIDLNFNFN